MKHIFNFFRGIFDMILTKTIAKENYIVDNTKPAWKSLCEECSFAAKKMGLTKKDSRKILKEIREKNNI